MTHTEAQVSVDYLRWSRKVTLLTAHIPIHVLHELLLFFNVPARLSLLLMYAAAMMCGALMTA